VKDFTNFTVYNLEVMSLLVYGILSENTVNLNHIAESLPYWAQNSSLYKRFIRFFDKKMDLRGVGLFLLRRFLWLLFQRFKKIKLYLIIDRHEWHYGRKVNNLLTVMIYEPRLGIGIPIQVLDLNSRGNSSFLERELVLEEIYNILRDYLGRDLVELEVLGDREFIGEEWEEYTGKRFGNYTLRVRRDYEVKEGRRVGEIFEDMCRGEVRDIRRDGWRIVIKRLESSSDRRDECLALVTLDMESDAEEIIDRYRARWWIERMFFNMESNGFKISETHFRDSSKVEMLFYVMAICYYISEVVGKVLEKIGEEGRRSVFLRGVRKLKRLLRGILVREVEKIWEILLEYERKLRNDLVFALVAKGVQ